MEYANSVSELLNLGSKNQLPEQITTTLVSDIVVSKDDTKESLVEAAPVPCALLLQESEAPQPSFAASEPAKKDVPRDATAILAEADYAHEQMLSAIVEQAAKLGVEAWSNHQESMESLANMRDELQERESRCRRTVLELRRQIMHLANRIEISGVDGEDNSDRQDLSRCRAEDNQLTARLNLLSEQIAQVAREISAERQRGNWLGDMASYVASVRAAHLHERKRHARTLDELQSSLVAVSRENSRADSELRCGDATVALEIQAAARITVVRVRERIREEGRRKRWLREEELSFFRADLRRLLEDRSARDERTWALQVVARARVECNFVLILRRFDFVSSQLNTHTFAGDRGYSRRHCGRDSCG